MLNAGAGSRPAPPGEPASPQAREAAVNSPAPAIKTPAAQQVGQPPIQQQEPAERQRVPAEHPLQPTWETPARAGSSAAPRSRSTHRSPPATGPARSAPAPGHGAGPGLSLNDVTHRIPSRFLISPNRERTLRTAPAGPSYSRWQTVNDYPVLLVA